jgi:OOP family OmpA-OmpF porin
MIRALAISLLTAVPGFAMAIEIALPEGSVLTVDQVTEAGSYALPVGVFADGILPTRQVDGYVSRQVWKLDGLSATTEQLMDPLRVQLLAAGFAILVDCEAASCGGFDFRFETEVLPAPDMFVDLIDYRFVSALRDTAQGTEALSALVSRTESAGLTQLIAVQPGAVAQDLPLITATTGQQPAQPSNVRTVEGALDVVQSLQESGRVILDDLTFETGSSRLANGDFASLQSIAEFLAQDQDQRIALVGHTDNVGSLKNNMALSKKRAQAVASALVERFGTDPAQLEADGVGYLAPLASNLTEDGRTANRRVEAVLLER